MKKLVELKKVELRRKYANVPEHAIPAPKYSDKTANSLTKAIIDFLNLSGHHAERISNTGRVINEPVILAGGLQKEQTINRGKWIPGTGRKGTSDIHASINGRFVAIEIKIGADRQSDSQKSYQRAVSKSGAQYWIVKDWRQFETVYENFLSGCNGCTDCKCG